MFVGQKKKEMKEKVDSPVTVLEDYFRSSDSESSSSKDPAVDSESQDLSKHASRWHAFRHLFRSGSKKHTNTLHPLGALKLSKRMSTSMRETILPSCFLDANASPCRSPWKIFSHHEIQVATNSFSQGMQSHDWFSLLGLNFQSNFTMFSTNYTSSFFVKRN